ncbi:MAG TPA: hypothetical protein PKM59_11635 [Thermodesulfobacteriota bacterium]|nr:hypothetical protein [Thermodesulfobacteriota bacterium]HNU70385.1 hypothetical protein [Thermodesulfobacteriota bacterium]
MIRCPKCGDKFDYREAQIEEEWIALIKLLPSFGGQGKLVWEYIEKFGVTPLAIKTKKMLRLFQEMAALFERGKFTLDKRVYEISQAGIIEALKEVNNREFKGSMTNHNYLKKVMIQIADRETHERSREDERKMRQREDRLRQGDRPDSDRDFDGNAKRVRDLVKSL